MSDEGSQLRAQRFVERAHGLVVERHWREPSAVDAASKMRSQSEAFAVRLVRSGGPLEVHEMLDHRLVERRQLDHDPGREIAGIERKIATSEAWRAAECGSDVPHRRQVTHLLDCDV